jgi:hypothetical protein
MQTGKLFFVGTIWFALVAISLILAVSSCHYGTDRCILRPTDSSENVTSPDDYDNQTARAAEWTPLAVGETDSREELARCLTTRGVVLYGTWWCGACRQQKEMFGPFVELLTYVECTPEGRPQDQRCIDLNITSVPTWIFPDGSRLVGRRPLQQLAQRSGCPYSEN